MSDQANNLRTIMSSSESINTSRAVEQNDQPPIDYDQFLAICTDIHVTKNHDYDSRFMKGLLQHGPAIYFWEAEKKLDRLRTWLERGELKVKGEGINNSVQDLFVYTVQYDISTLYVHVDDVLRLLTERHFYSHAGRYSSYAWLDFWTEKGLVKPHEEHLRRLLLTYMGVQFER